MRFPRTIGATAAALTWCLVPAAAMATGTIDIQHKGGHHEIYKDVDVRVFSGSLFLTSEDGDGTIVVTRAACSYQGRIIVCLPTLAALIQNGESNALNLKSGTIYLNYTDAPQQMSHSTSKLPADSVMLAMTTRNGTFITLRGTLDEVIKQ